MKMNIVKKLHFIILLQVVLAMSSCNLLGLFKNPGDQGTGSLSASIAYGSHPIVGSGLKVIRPALDFELQGFHWFLTGPNGQTKEYTNTREIYDQELATGLWNVRIVGKNVAGIVIAEGSKDVTIQPVITTNETIDVKLIPGKGRLRLEMSWPAGVLVNPTIIATIEKIDLSPEGSMFLGNPIDIDFGLSAGNAGAIYEGGDWESGYYVTTIRLLESGETTWGIREALYIVREETSAKTYMLPGASLKSRPKAPSAFMIRNYGAGADGNQEIEIVWKDESDNEALFIIERRLAGQEFTILDDEIPMDSNSFIDKGLDKSKVYEYRISAKNMWGSSDFTNIIKTDFPDVIEVSEDIVSNQRWVKENAFIIKGQRKINEGVTLTIDPGTTIKFDEGASLDIYGIMIADGSTQDLSGTIQFSQLKLDGTYGSWEGMTFHGPTTSASVLKNISLSNGRSLKFENSFPLVDTVKIKNFKSAYPWDDGNEERSVVKFQVSSGSSPSNDPYVIKNLEVDNTTFGVTVYIGETATGSMEFQNLSVTNSSNRAVRITNSSSSFGVKIVDSLIKSSSTGIFIDASNEKTIIEKSIIEANSTGIYIGSTNNLPQNGIIKNSIIRSNNTGLSLSTRDSRQSTFKILGNAFTSNSSQPLYAFTGNNGLHLSGNDFLSNNDGVSIHGSPAITFDSNSFQGTLNGRELLMNGAVGLNASYNYWGTVDSNLIKFKIHDRLDDGSLGEVKFQPFLSKPAMYLKPEYPIGGQAVKEYLFEFSWGSYTRPNEVEFILARDAAMSDIIHSIRGDLGNSYRLPNDIRDKLLENTQYYWKVGSIKDGGEATFGGTNVFVTSQQGIGIDLIQFEEEVAIESLPDVLYTTRTYDVKAVAAKSPDKYRWTLGSELIQEGVLDTCSLEASKLGPGNYILTVKAYYGSRHVSVSKSFRIEPMKVMEAWALPYSTVVRRNDGLTLAWGTGFWNNGEYLQTPWIHTVNYGEILDYQSSQDIHYWLKNDGSLWSASIYDALPKKIASNITSFSIGGKNVYGHFVLAIKNDGTVIAWGENNNGQLGIGNTISQTKPTQVFLPGLAIQVSGGILHGLALLEDGRVFGWGYMGYGALGSLPPGSSHIITTPIELIDFRNVESITAGPYCSFFITKNGSVYGVGTNSNGNMGIGIDGGTWGSPISVIINEPVSKVITNHESTFAITNAGSLYSWGRNSDGILGQNSDRYMLTIPNKIAENVKKVMIGYSHACYIDINGALWLWGSNSNWQQKRLIQEESKKLPIVINWGGEL